MARLQAVPGGTNQTLGSDAYFDGGAWPVSNELIELLVDLVEALLKTDPVVNLHGGGFVQHLVQVTFSPFQHCPVGEYLSQYVHVLNHICAALPAFFIVSQAS